MKYNFFFFFFIFFFWSASSSSLPYYRHAGQKFIEQHEDGSIEVSCLDGRRIVLKIPLHSNYLDVMLQNFDKVSMGKKCNNEEVILKQDYAEYENQDQPRKSQGEILQECFQNYKGVVNAVDYEELLKKVQHCVQTGDLHPSVYEALTCMREPWQLQQNEIPSTSLSTMRKALWEGWLKTYLNKRQYQQNQMYPQVRSYTYMYQQPLEEQYQKEFYPETSQKQFMRNMMLQKYMNQRNMDQNQQARYPMDDLENQQTTQWATEQRTKYLQPRRQVEQQWNEVPREQYQSYHFQEQKSRDQPETEWLQTMLQPRYSQDEQSTGQGFQTGMQGDYRLYRQQPTQYLILNEEQQEQSQYPRYQFLQQQYTPRVPRGQQMQEQQQVPQQLMQDITYQPGQRICVQLQGNQQVRCPWVRYQLAKNFGDMREN